MRALCYLMPALWSKYHAVAPQRLESHYTLQVSGAQVFRVIGKCLMYSKAMEEVLDSHPDVFALPGSRPFLSVCSVASNLNKTQVVYFQAV